jgi:hypothetical protein
MIFIPHVYYKYINNHAMYAHILQPKQFNNILNIGAKEYVL